MDDSEQGAPSDPFTVESIVHHFLTGRRLRKVFAHLCNHASGQVTDPISDVAHIMITRPVQMMISEVGLAIFPCTAQWLDQIGWTRVQVGVALFKDRPNALFPFSKMDAGQRFFVERVVAACMEQHERVHPNGAGFDDDDEWVGRRQQGCTRFSSKVVMQMGGGCILFTEPERRGAKACTTTSGSSSIGATEGTEVSVSEVFDALCDCVFASKR